MLQGFLFEPEAMALTELQDAIVRLDFAVAVRKLQEFRSIWGDAKLTWEPELIQAGFTLTARTMNLDSGYRAWEQVEARLNATDMASSLKASLERNFFSRLLAANRKLFEEPRTAEGRFLGDFYLLAGQPRNARRRYENDVRQTGDGWKVRLQLGNCDFRLGNGTIAHSNYYWSFVQGLPEDHWPRIEDSAFLNRLRAAEETEWAFAEICATGQLALARFSSRTEFDAFKRKYSTAFSEAPAPGRFCLYWAVSQNKTFCSDAELLDARRRLKALHPRLHAQYMERLTQTL